MQALSSIHLRIPAERTVVLIGPSGCGKSTLLRLIIGLVRPDRGEIGFEGSKIHLQDILELRHQMGYVIQNGGLFPHLTARQNVTLMARHLKWKKRDIEDRLLALAELTQFPPDGLERYPMQLSGGQKQRVALMRALMLDPKVLLLDEPLGALDPIIRFDLQTDLKGIFQKLHKTVVLVTHDLDEAEYFGDVIVLMRDGQIVQQGSIREMMNAAVDPFVSRFIHAQQRHEQASV
ncbi:MAG TPA: ATP-binding cassette domain-containing protein [Thermodesulfobacteriota bacterium]|nr:ATP-binding cassette domain-containing protein [Thermodesulfobacteriota bacterium]